MKKYIFGASTLMLILGLLFFYNMIDKEAFSEKSYYENLKPELQEEEEGKGDKNRSWTSKEAKVFYTNYSKVFKSNTLLGKTRGTQKIGGGTYANGNLNGEWKSRGPYNMPGAFQFCEMDEGTDTVYAVTCGHYGGVQFIWKGTLTDDKWDLINPKHPARFDDVIVIPFNDNRRVFAGQQFGELIYSDDGGATWQVASGLASNSRSTIVNRQDNHVLYTTDGTKVYTSTDGGTTFTTLQDFGSEANNTRLYSPRWVSQPRASKVYLVRDGNFYTLNGAKTSFDLTGSVTVNQSIAISGDDRKLWIVLDETYWYSSTNGGATWNSVNTTGYWYNDVTDDMYAGQFIGVSPEDPDVLLGGYSNPLITRDAGVTTNSDAKSYWGYYQNSVGNDPKVRVNYHPDFQSSQFFYDKDGRLITLRSSDGGVFISDNEWVKTGFPTYADIEDVYYNITLLGLPTQEGYRGGFIYGNQHKDHLSVGTQDQGWQDTRSNTFGEEELSWDQIGGGDGPCCVTGDGQVGWKYNYQGNGGFQRFDLYNGTTFLGQNATRSTATDFSFTGSSYFTPSVGDWDDGDRIWVLSQTLRRIEYNGSTTTAKEDFFGVGNSYIQGLAQSHINPDIVYSMRDGAVYRSLNRGTDWLQVSANTATAISGYNQCRGMGWSSPIDENIVLFATGSGTSVKSIFSIDGGASWENVTGSGANLFPSTEVNGMAGSKDGQFVFAATEVGPYVFVVNEKLWYSLATDVDVPLFWGQVVYCVDYGDKEVVHFSTWGQGVWDFEIGGALLDHNVAVTSLTNNSVVSCGGTIDPVVTIKNIGVFTLTSIDIKVYVKDVLVKSINHTTSLNTYGTEEVVLTSLAIDGDGNEEIKVVLESPNGQVDASFSDNERSIILGGNEVPLGMITGISVSSQSGVNGIENTIDDDISTIWHNDWQGSAAMPHELIYDLGDVYSLTGFNLLSRQDNFNGIIKDIDVAVSNDGVTWGRVQNIACANSVQWESYELTIGAGRYFKLTVKSNQYGNDVASFAEVKFVGCQIGGLTAKIDSPIEGSEFYTGESVSLGASVTSDGIISKVEFYLDDVLVGTDVSSSYSFTILNLVEGEHSLKVIAYDNVNGPKESSEVFIQVTTPVEYDIAISNLNRTDNVVCGSSIDLNFDVIINGIIPITLFDAELYLDNQLIQTVAQTIALNEGATTNISILGVTLETYGSQELKVRLVNPNGMTDENESDNEEVVSITLEEGSLHEFFIAERSVNPSLSWEITEGGTILVSSVGITKSINDADQIQEFCLAAGCFDVVVTNAFTGGSCTVGAWSSSTSYCEGDQISYNGVKYEANWCGSGNLPDELNYQWTDLGVCAVSYDTDAYGVRKIGEPEYFSVEVQDYTSAKTSSFSTGSLLPSISIALMNQSFPVCSDVDVIYGATLLNTGSALVAWYLNDSKMQDGGSFRVMNIANGESVSARVASNDPCVSNTEVVSSTIVSQVETCTGVVLFDNETYKVYPNPTQDVFYIEGGFINQIQIVNAVGNVLASYEVEADEFAVDISEYTPGVYFIKIIAEEEPLIKPVYKN